MQLVSLVLETRDTRDTSDTRLERNILYKPKMRGWICCSRVNLTPSSTTSFHSYWLPLKTLQLPLVTVENLYQI